MKLKGITAVFLIVVALVFAMRPTAVLKPTAEPVSTKTRARLAGKDTPFWNSAEVPVPDTFREPITAVIGQKEAPFVDHPAEVARLEAAGDIHSLNFALAGWFDAAPLAARDWLAEQDSLDSFQPALAMIAGKIAATGEPANALQWATLLPPGPQQEQSLFDIYALAARAGHFTEDQLRAAPLPPERVRELLSGAAGD